MVKTIKSLWAGEVPLGVAFWQYAVVYGLLINIVTSILFVALVVMNVSLFLLVPAYLIPTPYNVLIIVAVWRSAEHYQGPKRWADLARAVTLIGMLLLSVT